MNITHFKNLYFVQLGVSGHYAETQIPPLQPEAWAPASIPYINIPVSQDCRLDALDRLGAGVILWVVLCF